MWCWGCTFYDYIFRLSQHQQCGLGNLHLLEMAQLNTIFNCLIVKMLIYELLFLYVPLSTLLSYVMYIYIISCCCAEFIHHFESSSSNHHSLLNSNKFKVLSSGARWSSFAPTASIIADSWRTQCLMHGFIYVSIFLFAP